MKTTDKMLEATKELWKSYNEHPFVKGIQDGSLDKDKFKYYIMQDYLYLKEYAKVFAIGVAKAKTLETANLFAKYIAVMNGELDVHSGYMGKFNVSQEEIDDMNHLIIYLIPLICYVLLMKKEKQKSWQLYYLVLIVMKLLRKRLLKIIQIQSMMNFMGIGSKAMLLMNMLVVILF